MALQAILFADDRIPDEMTPPALRRLYGISMIERHVRTCASRGVREVTVIGTPDSGDRIQRHLMGLSTPCTLSYLETDIASVVAPGASYLLVDARHVYDQRALDAVIQAGPNTMLVDAAATPGSLPGGACRLAVIDAVALIRLMANWTDSAVFWDALTAMRRRGECHRLNIRDIDPYIVNLRRSLPLFWLAVETRYDERVGEAHLIETAQKGTLDFPAQYLHPPFENGLTRLLAKTPVTPNHITSATNAIAFAATALLAGGALVPGLLLAILVGILDGVDGKLARVTVRCSKFGDRYEHILDNVYELSWYWALGWALDSFMLSGVMTVSYLLDRAATGSFKHVRGIELFDYTPFDRFFRRIGGRRNIYILMLCTGALLHVPGPAFQAVVAWSVVTACVHWGRAIWLFLLPKKEHRPAVYTREVVS